MVIRKIRSGIKKILFKIINSINHLKIYFLENNVRLGNNVSIGKNVIIKTTDGGEIIIGDNTSIEDNCYIYAQYGELTIGKNSFIGFGSQVVAKKTIKIGEDNLIASYCIIRDANHGIKRDKCINNQPHIIEDIEIEDDVWMGAHSVVTAGCRIGKGAVVGANTVVTKDIAPYTVVGGVPAKFIKYRE